ncbi:hypothetical protein SEPCBS119000_001460 [Sporothrix epigloea]|uniref:CID domain-containing protein n=1 Tax=Sporothrix epigloea TaxID=1892477 RepID=A0ABP0DEM1_9PEZI
MSGNGSSPFNVRFPAKPIAKKSLFERQRAEAEAKRQREAAETATVYKEFVESFGDGSGNSSSPSFTPDAAPGAPRSELPAHNKSTATVGTTGGRRHFSIPSKGPSSHRNSGPGSLGPASQLGRPARDGRPTRTSGVSNKLGFGSDDDDDGDNGGGGFDTNERGGIFPNKKRKVGSLLEEGQIAEDGGGATDVAMNWAEEKATSKPTIRLANLPPGTSPAAVKALVISSSSLVVDAVRILPTATAVNGGPFATATDRKSVAAIVTLSAETAASGIDAAVSAMQNRYLGFGYYLSLHRHLSSAVAALSTSSGGAAGGGLAGGGSGSSQRGGAGAGAQPFGARLVPPTPKAGPGAQHPVSEGFGPPTGGFHGGRYSRGLPPPAHFAPPAATINTVNRDGLFYVPVRPPRDIKKLRMVHKVLEQVLDHGPEFEALLMSRPAVQLEEKWAWLWDARSEAGVWYRYRLWETVTGLRTQKSSGLSRQAKGRYVPLFEGSHAWKTPEQFLPYEFVTSLDELVSDADYNSSDDSDADAGEGTVDEDKETFLNPLDKARLAHLLARLPTTISKLRKGDVARVTSFALAHASRGANEIVDMIVANVERPLAFTAVNPDRQRICQVQALGEAVDTSSAQLVAVYVVSDILSSSATSGIRHAWRFRQLFDAALRRHNVFATLGRLAGKFHWGRLRADKWKRSIGLVLDQWEGWSVFSAETQAFLVSSFENALMDETSKDEKLSAAAVTVKDGEMSGATTALAKNSRWKTVDKTAAPEQGPLAAAGPRQVDTATDRDANKAMQLDGEDSDKNENGAGGVGGDDAEWTYRSDYTDDEALDLACLSDEDIDGEPLELFKVAGVGRESQRYRRRHRYDGIPLTADEIFALTGGEDEMSEGEIATDDDYDDFGDDNDYHLGDLSSLSDSSGESGSDMESSKDGNEKGSTGHDRDEIHEQTDILMNDAPIPETAASTAETGRSMAGPEYKPDVASVRAPSPDVRNNHPLPLLKSSATPQLRKRMRAADMFADSSSDESR